MIDASKNETEAIQQGGYSASMETAREFVRRMAEDGIQGNLYGLLTSLCIRDAAIREECSDITTSRVARVPRKMLEEIACYGFSSSKFDDDYDNKEQIDRIAAKYGVEITEE